MKLIFGNIFFTDANGLFCEEDSIGIDMKRIAGSLELTEGVISKIDLKKLAPVLHNLLAIYY